jgi:hypothetical protein
LLRMWETRELRSPDKGDRKQMTHAPRSQTIDHARVPEIRPSRIFFVAELVGGENIAAVSETR